MVIIHKKRVSINILDMDPGTVFFSGSGDLMMVTDDRNAVDNVAACVNLKTGSIRYYYDGELGIPQCLTTVEVE